jgi:DNA mismatch endonuclease, patch repair protein
MQTPSHNPPPTSTGATRSMRGNKGKDTKPELLVRRLLREAGFPGYRLHWKKAPGRPDIAYPGRKVAIFVNGCYWHRCPHCSPPMPKAHSDFWAEKFIANEERDARQMLELEHSGWTVIVLWECELKRDPGGAVEHVLPCLEPSRTPVRPARHPPSEEDTRC